MAVRFYDPFLFWLPYINSWVSSDCTLSLQCQHTICSSAGRNQPNRPDLEKEEGDSEGNWRLHGAYMAQLLPGLLLCYCMGMYTCCIIYFNDLRKNTVFLVRIFISFLYSSWWIQPTLSRYPPPVSNCCLCSLLSLCAVPLCLFSSTRGITSTSVQMSKLSHEVSSRSNFPALCLG